jgi:hypothetical protein
MRWLNKLLNRKKPTAFDIAFDEAYRNSLNRSKKGIVYSHNKYDDLLGCEGKVIQDIWVNERYGGLSEVKILFKDGSNLNLEFGKKEESWRDVHWDLEEAKV